MAASVIFATTGTATKTSKPGVPWPILIPSSPAIASNVPEYPNLLTARWILSALILY